MMAAAAECSALLLSASGLSIRQRFLIPSRAKFISPNAGFRTNPLPQTLIFSRSKSLVAGEAPGPCAVDTVAVEEAAEALDIRVGRIIKAWRHPEADSLYVEEVDVGEPTFRTICSGLVNYVSLDRLQDIKVVVLANLKPRIICGIRSNGMLLAASDASHMTVELLSPPEDSVPGERIWFGSDEDKDKQPNAATPTQIKKKKIWELVQPNLKTTDKCVAALGDHTMRTSAGVIKCKSLKNANIS